MEDYLTVAPKLLFQSSYLFFQLGHKVIAYEYAT